MRRILLLAAALAAALPSGVRAQMAQGGFVALGQGGGGTALLAPRFSLDAGYLVEVGEGDGPFLGARYTFGLHRLRVDQEGYRALFRAEVVEGGEGTLYDTGGDVEAGIAVGVLRVYGFAGIHFYQQFQSPAVLRDGEGEHEVFTHSRQTLALGRGVGVELRVPGTGGGLMGEWYRGGGDDGVMRISGARFGLRWAW